MSGKYKQELATLIADYQLWVASIEQYLEDNQVYQTHIVKRLQAIKRQLNNLTRINSLLVLTDKIISIDQSLNIIQLKLPGYSYNLITA